MEKRRTLFLPYLLLLLLPFCVFWRGIFGKEIIVLGDFTGSDFLDLHLPFKYALHTAYTSGELPLWIHNLANGFSLAAEGQSGPFYPPNIILSFVEPYLALNLSVVLAFVVAGCGAYILARSYGLGKLASLWVGIVFMFCSFFVARIKHLNMIVVAGYLPWSLYCLKRAVYLEGSIKEIFISLKWFILLGVVWALQLLAGHPHMAYLSIFMVLWHWGAECVFIVMHYRREAGRLLKRMGLGIFVSFVAGISLAAVQLFPTAELVLLTLRTQMNFDKVAGNSMHGRFLLSLIYPFVWGNPADGTYRTLDLIREGIWWEDVLYIGLLPFIFASGFLIKKSFVFVRSLRRSSDRIDWILSALFRMSHQSFTYVVWVLGSLFFMSLAFGKYSLTFLLAYYVVPGMQLFRFPMRFNLYLLLALSLCSGIAFSYICKYLIKQLGFWGARGVIVVSFFVLLADIFVFTNSYISYIPARDYLAEPETISVVADSDLSRIFPLTHFEVNPYYLSGWKTDLAEIKATQESIPGDNALRFGLDSYSDRTWLEGGLTPKERFFLEYYLYSHDNLQLDAWAGVLGAWNVKYLFTHQNLHNYVLKKEFEYNNFYKSSLKVYENTKVLPRAYISSGTRYIEKAGDVVERMKSPDWNPRAETLVSRGSLQRGSLGSGDVTFISYTNNMVEMRVSTTDKSVLVFSDSYYPGWHAFVDAKEMEIFPVNLTQRGVYVDKGLHTVRWLFKPMSVYYGLAFSLISAILIGIGFIFYSIRFRQV